MSESQEQLEQLQAQLDRKRAHLQRAIKYYDEAPDGSKQKQDAVGTMNSLNLQIHEIEKQFDALM